MHKAFILPAAALAAVISLGSPVGAEARTGARQTAVRRSTAHRGKPAVSGRARAAAAKKNRAKTRKAAPVGRSASRHGRRKTARKVIRQNGQGEVVIDRVELIGLPPGTAGQVAGPSREMQNYPPAPCEPADVVIEAHVHEMGQPALDADAADLIEETAENESEPAAADDRSASGTRASLARIASRIGSFFRPKSSESEVKPQDVDLRELVSKSFLIPVEGVDVERLRDSFLSSRGRHAKHLAIDIGAPKGTPIVATTDGEIVRISKERRGGNAIYQKDSTGRYLLFYCHLSRYGEDLAVGRQVKKGDVIGYVGSTGHVIGGSHLHFSITRLPDDGDSFRKGLAINPYLLFLARVN